MISVELNLPVAFGVEDYHEFSDHIDVIRLMNKKLKVSEVAFGPDRKTGRVLYWGLVYFNHKPDKATIMAVLEKAGWDKDNEDSTYNF